MEAASSCCRIVSESLTGEREVDERTFASIAILTERLERLKRFGGLFAGVDFSTNVKRLKSRADAVPVG
jgi:predicted GTPase